MKLSEMVSLEKQRAAAIFEAHGTECQRCKGLNRLGISWGDVPLPHPPRFYLKMAELDMAVMIAATVILCVSCRGQAAADRKYGADIHGRPKGYNSGCRCEKCNVYALSPTSRKVKQRYTKKIGAVPTASNLSVSPHGRGLKWGMGYFSN